MAGDPDRCPHCKSSPASTPTVFNVGGAVSNTPILVEDRETGVGFYLSKPQAQLLASRLIIAAPLMDEHASPLG